MATPSYSTEIASAAVWADIRDVANHGCDRLAGKTHDLMGKATVAAARSSPIRQAA